jgi:hypothetical protein
MAEGFCERGEERCEEGDSSVMGVE